MIKYCIIFLFFSGFTGFSQSTNPTFLEAIKKLQSGEYKEAILLLDKVIIQNPSDFAAIYNRGVAKSILRKYDESLKDLNLAIKLKPESKKAILNRGIVYKKLANYVDAQVDFNMAIKLDGKFGDALYNRAMLFELLNKNDEACTDYKKAKEAGNILADPKVELCETPINERAKTNSLLSLMSISTDKTYGFTIKNPIKVGTSPNGAAVNEQTYLEHLRDEKGQMVTYKFLGNCCEYTTKNVFGGKAKLNQYEITYLNKSGKLITSKIYFTPFEFNPEVLLSFTCIKAKL
jgi:tetratricopeptide (TPR) repeat protein